MASPSRMVLLVFLLASLPACITAYTHYGDHSQLPSVLKQVNDDAVNSEFLRAGAGFLEVASKGESTYSPVRPLLIIGGCLFALVLLAGTGICWAPAKIRCTVVDYAIMLGYFCGLCISFVAYGIIQEYIMTHNYPHGGNFPSAAFLVFCNRVFGMMILAVVLCCRRKMFFPEGCLWCGIPSVTMFVSTMCQHSALRYVSFPVKIAFKSGKIVPTMAVGSCMVGKQHRWRDYVVGALTTGCVIGFSMSHEDFKDQREQPTKVLGICLMVVYLICDALTSNYEKQIFNIHPDISTCQMMFIMAVFSAGYSVVTMLTTGDQAQLFAFLTQNPAVMWHIAGLSIAAVAGQLFVFQVIRSYGPVVLSVMMTIRMMVSMSASAVLFGHHLTTDARIYAFVLIAVLIGDAWLKFIDDQKGYGQERFVWGQRKEHRLSGDTRLL